MLVATRCSKRRVIIDMTKAFRLAPFLPGTLTQLPCFAASPRSHPLSHSLRCGASNILLSSSVLGRAVRLHRNQLFYSLNFAVDEDDVRNFDGRPAASRYRRAEVTGAETKGRPE